MPRMNAKQIAAWKTAHPTLHIPEDILASCGPWPSLEANDFMAYAKGNDRYPQELVKFVGELRDELVFCYDMWTKCVAQSNAEHLLKDLLYNTAGNEAYNFTRKFLLDYAHAHGLFVEDPVEEAPPPWRVGIESGGGVPVQPPLPREAVEAGNVEPPK